jgi:predicted DNA-binding transcriptional regulator YafY
LNWRSSLIKDYSEAIDKIKSVFTLNIKDKANLLTDRTQFTQIEKIERTSSNLSILQFALTNFLLTKIEYANEANEITDRTIEPFALLSVRSNWLLVAWCLLRQDFRYFRLDRIKKIEILSETFTPHDLTLQEYFDRYH